MSLSSYSLMRTASIFIDHHSLLFHCLGDHWCVFFLCLIAKGIPQTLLLEDEEKRILESREDTSLSPLSLFKVGMLCRTLLDSIVIKSGLLKQHRLPVVPLSLSQSWVTWKKTARKNGRANSWGRVFSRYTRRTKRNRDYSQSTNNTDWLMPVLRVKNTISSEVVHNLDVQPNSRNQKNYN